MRVVIFLDSFCEMGQEIDARSIHMRALFSSENIDDTISKLAHYSTIDIERKEEIRI